MQNTSKTQNRSGLYIELYKKNANSGTAYYEAMLLDVVHSVIERELGRELHKRLCKSAKDAATSAEHADAFVRSLSDVCGDIAVLTPCREGPFGTAGLNEYIMNWIRAWERMTYMEVRKELWRGIPEETVNSASHNLKMAYMSHIGAVGKIFTGMRVMCIKNDYEKDIFNGECGTVCSSNVKRGIIRVYYKARNIYCNYNIKEAAEYIVPAYAMTIHKSQGSEYLETILVIPPYNDLTYVDKNLIYTAVTRASETLVITGDANVFKQACYRSSEVSGGLLNKKLKKIFPER